MRRLFYGKLGLIVCLLLLPALLGGCVTVGFGRGHLRGNGKIETRDLTPGEFTGVSIGGGVEFVYREGTECKLEIETDQNLFEDIRVRVLSDGTLDIRSDHTQSPTRSIVYVTAPTLKKIECSGAVEFICDNAIRADSLDIEISGACAGTLSVEATKIKADISGASDMEIEGSCDEIRLELSGAGNVNARGLTAKDADLKISGAGGMSITCENNLNASISGAGSITYYGDPHVSPDISGAATIRKG